jgi:hypothetical protein
MYNYTYKQHFKFGYNDKWFNQRTSPDDKWHVDYGSIERDVGDFRQESFKVARLIEDEATRLGLPIDLMYSGGTESEMMVRSFIEQGIPVRINIMKFSNGLNMHDIKDALAFCEENNITPTMYDLDILKFWENDCWDYAERTKCISPQLLSTMWLMDQLDGLPVMGSAECYIAHEDLKKFNYWEPTQGKVIKKNFSKDEYMVRPWYMHEREKIAAWYRHPMQQDRPAVPGYFQYTPEIMLSFLEDPFEQELAACKHTGKLSNTSTKLHVYEKYFPNLRQKVKTTGFEQIMESDKVVRTELYRLYGMYSAEAKWEYNSLKSHLQGERNGHV